MDNSDLSLVHEVLRPISKDEKPPLLLMLHGYGSHENDLFSMAPMLNSKALIVSLRAPFSLHWGGFAWYEIDFTQMGNNRMSNISQAKQSIELLMQEIPRLQAKYNTDPDRTWLMGFSQGCILSYVLALNHPDKFSKVLALSGYIHNDLVPQQYNPREISHLDFFVSHGTADEVLPVDWARTSMQVLEQLKISHQYREYPMGHGVSPACFDDMKIWMKERGVI